MSTMEELKQKIANKEELTTAEIYLKMVTDLAKHKPRDKQIEFRNQEISFILDHPEQHKLTEADKKRLTEELSKKEL